MKQVDLNLINRTFKSQIFVDENPIVPITIIPTTPGTTTPGTTMPGEDNPIIPWKATGIPEPIEIKPTIPVIPSPNTIIPATIIPVDKIITTEGAFDPLPIYLIGGAILIYLMVKK